MCPKSLRWWRGRFKTPSQVFWLPSQRSSSSIRDVLKAAKDFPWSEWYPSRCSHRRCHITLSLDSSGQCPLSQVMPVLVGYLSVPSVWSGQSRTGTRRCLLERIYCPALTLPSPFHTWFPSETPPPEAHPLLAIYNLQSLSCKATSSWGTGSPVETTLCFSMKSDFRRRFLHQSPP